ncbi:histidinol-phosphate transaminase [Oscillospiraceae bacterium PP1C4]
MYELPEKLKNLVPYHPLTGSYSIRLDANESFITLPDALREEIAKSVAAVDFNRYPDPYCTDLCQKFADFFDIDASLVVAGNGSDELIGLIVSSFAGSGDTMAVVKPEFSMYEFYAQMYGVNVEAYEKDSTTLAIDADELISFVREKNARILILSNPCNPTSLTATQQDIQKIVSSLDCVVVIDEAYMDFSEGSVLRMAGEYDNLIVLKTCSKAFGMAAIRLGFAAASLPITQAIKAAKSPYNVNSMTQTVGCLLFEQKEYLLGCIGRIKCSRNWLYEEILALAAQKSEILSVSNTCANFVFMRLANPKYVFEELGKQGIAVRCMEPFLRITAGSQQENSAVIAVLSEILR